MAPTEPKISKEAATVTTTDIPFTVAETLQIIKKPGNATSQCHYGCFKIGFLTIYGLKKHQ
jgi:hypothetical protein